MQVTLCLTHDCTLRCPYCYAGEKRRKAMPWEVAKAAIDRTVAWQLAHYPEKDYVLGCSNAPTPTRRAPRARLGCASAER